MHLVFPLFWFVTCTCALQLQAPARIPEGSAREGNVGSVSINKDQARYLLAALRSVRPGVSESLDAFIEHLSDLEAPQVEYQYHYDKDNTGWAKLKRFKSITGVSWSITEQSIGMCGTVQNQDHSF